MLTDFCLPGDAIMSVCERKLARQLTVADVNGQASSNDASTMCVLPRSKVFAKVKATV